MRVFRKGHNVWLAILAGALVGSLVALSGCKEESAPTPPPAVEPTTPVPPIEVPLPTPTSKGIGRVEGLPQCKGTYTFTLKAPKEAEALYDLLLIYKHNGAATRFPIRGEEMTFSGVEVDMYVIDKTLTTDEALHQIGHEECKLDCHWEENS